MQLKKKNKKYKNLHCTTSSPIHPWISSIVKVQGTILLEATTESTVNVHLVDSPLVYRGLLKLHMLHWTHHLHIKKSMTLYICILPTLNINNGLVNKTTRNICINVKKVWI